MKLSVVIPSRLAAIAPAASGGPWFVERAIAAVRRQSVFARSGLLLQLVVGVDPGMVEVAERRLGGDVTVVAGTAATQAHALNAGLACCDGDVVAMLEDDDAWSEQYLERSLAQFERFGFVSSTQLEIGTDGGVIGVLDYPTPSGWLMTRATLSAVGDFDPSFRWHLDSDWLGRLGEAAVDRCHLIEATAPVRLHEIMSWRPLLANVLRNGAPSIAFVRHDSPWPLVLRTVHPGSGMAMIRSESGRRAASDAEFIRLRERYGRIPS